MTQCTMGKKNRVTGYWLLTKDIEYLVGLPTREIGHVADILYTERKERYKVRATEIREQGQRFTQDLKKSDIPTGLVSQSEVEDTVTQVKLGDKTQEEADIFARVARATAQELAFRDRVHPSDLEPEDLISEIQIVNAQDE